MSSHVIASRNEGVGGVGPSARVLVVDPSPVVRVGVTRILHETSPHIVVECCEGQDEAFELVRRLQPDVVLTDVVLAQGSGLGLLRALQDHGLDARIVFFSFFDEALVGLAIARAGGVGYVSKNEGGEQLVQAVTRALAGELTFTDRVRQQLLELRRGKPLTSRRAHPGGLSPREFDVFRLMGKGLATEDIARRLKISATTVGLHRFSINHKLGCRHPAELYRIAVLWSEGIMVRDGSDEITRMFLQADVAASGSS